MCRVLVGRGRGADRMARVCVMLHDAACPPAPPVPRQRKGLAARQPGPHPTPCTLHPKPFTLHPTPYTLHPTPYTLHPTPYTLHPTPCTIQASSQPGHRWEMYATDRDNRLRVLQARSNAKHPSRGGGLDYPMLRACVNLCSRMRWCGGIYAYDLSYRSGTYVYDS